MAILLHWQTWLWPLSALSGSILAALLAHYLVFALAKRIAERPGSVISDSVVKRAEGPTRWIFPLVAIVLALPALPVRWELVQLLRQIVGLGVIASTAWVIILLTEVLGDTIYARYRVDTSDNLEARRVRTQIAMLRRIFNIVVIVITIGIMLMTFPEVKQLGTSLLASAGLAGLVIGMAMKSTFSNLIAGLQIALTGPIRIEDVVIVEGEWGWIEDILTTYVVVRTWDLRRLIVPLSYFIDNVFQNWTRRTSDLLAYVYIYCDYRVPVEEVRQEFRRVVESTPLWDRNVCVLQVSDASEHTIQIRALTSASDSSKAWDLRCYVREKLIQFLREKYPESLPTSRIEFRNFSQQGQPLIAPLPAANGNPYDGTAAP
ncbi:MAG TPA: mechanosensitive ion channel domain-containing protein [Bryobacteraceae bacterium]|nr:mechanosensitive ion channel domain-containing protein [Bryobacteraceae bacterium]